MLIQHIGALKVLRTHPAAVAGAMGPRGLMMVKRGFVVITLLACVADEQGDLVQTPNSREVAGFSGAHAPARGGENSTSLNSSGHWARLRVPQPPNPCR